MNMSAVKSLALAFATSLVLAGSALAAESEGMAWVIDPGPSGVKQMRFSTDGMAAFMKQNPKPLPAGTFIVQSGGKLYMLDDPKGTLYNQWRDKMIQGM
jgi:hypothetical protein